MSIRQYLFAGDAGIAQATQIPTMSEAADSKVLSIQTDLGAYNCWQKCILDDNVYETYRQEVLPVVNSWSVVDQPGLTLAQRGININEYLQPHTLHKGQVAFQFELMGMTNMKRIFLDYVANIRLGYQPQVDPILTNPTINGNMSVALSAWNGRKASDLVQPEFALLDCMRRVEFCIGKDRLIFEDGSVETIKARKVHLGGLNLQPQEAAQIARLGLRYAKNITNQSTGGLKDATQLTNWAFGRASIFNRELFPGGSLRNYMHTSLGVENFESLDEYSQYYDQYMNTVLRASNNPSQTYDYTTGVPQTWYDLSTTDGNAPHTIPLFALIPFLAQSNTYLPKGLPIEIRIDFEYYAGSQFLMASQQLFQEITRNGATTAPGRVALNTSIYEGLAYRTRTIAGLQNHNNGPDQPFLVYEGPNTIKQTLRLTYDYFVLKENLQKEFNLTWLNQPLLYNYFKWRRYDVMDQTAGPTTNLSYNLLINQQRPLAIFLRFETLRNEASLSTTISSNPSNITVGGNRYEHGGVLPGSNSIVLENTLRNTTRIRFDQPVINYITGSCAGNAINLLECYVGSQLVYRADVRSQTSTNGYTASSTMDSMIKNNRDNNSQMVEATQIMQNLTMYDNANAYEIPLSQNRAYERGVYALDRGNTNLRFNMRLDQPLDTTKYTLALYAKYPAQMTIDKSYSAVESQWPVIIAQNGPLVQSQYNIN